VEGLATFFSRGWALFLLGLPIALVEAVLTTDWMGAWNRWVWLFLILYGFLFASDDRFSEAVIRRRRAALILGTVCYLLYFAGVGMLTEAAGVDAFTDRGAPAIVVRFLKGIAAWLWVVGIMGIATRWGRRLAAAPQEAPSADGGPTLGDRISAYAQEAQLPFYILHHTPIIVIGYYVVQWQTNALVKFLVISFASLAVTLLVYDLAVRRIGPVRALFGMRPRRRA
jgi:hypothetical protein